MITPATKEAVEAGRKAIKVALMYQLDMKEGVLEVFSRYYKSVFEILEMPVDCTGKLVTEIGCGNVPAAHFVLNDAVNIVLIECEKYPILDDLVKVNGYKLIEENIESLRALSRCDEIWLFNILSTASDPEKIVSICKKVSDKVRFFEPIGMQPSGQWLHSITLDDYRRWFGDCVRFYEGGSRQLFHTQDCAYGTWVKPPEFPADRVEKGSKNV